MNSWSGGYVTELPYTAKFYAALAPVNQRLATLLAGFVPPDIDSEFTYCELGCGRGYGVNLIAAANPQGRFYATDFNPVHIAEARSLASAAGSENMHFFDDSFDELLQRELPDFDVIALHGIWSWVSEKNRAVIVQFLRRKLKVGGVVYLGYNVLPGWASAAPFRDLLARLLDDGSADVRSRLRGSVALAQELADAGARYFSANQFPKMLLERAKTGADNTAYLVHEYMNKDWNPMYFADVASELSDAKLQFLSSLRFSDHVARLNFAQPALKLLQNVPDPVQQQTCRDFLLNSAFRRDIFGKGVARLDRPAQLERLGKQRFVRTAIDGNITMEHRFPIGQLSLESTVYQPVLDALATRAMTVTELAATDALVSIDSVKIIEALVVLTGVGYVSPALGDSKSALMEERKARATRFNHAALERMCPSKDAFAVASPETGSGIYLSPDEQCILLARLDGKDPVDLARTLLGQVGRKRGSEADFTARITAAVETFDAHRLPLLRLAGVI